MEARYLIVGGGMAGDAAAKALHRADPSGRTVMITREEAAPYRRPFLSKDLWNKEGAEGRLDLGTTTQVDALLTSKKVTSLDPARSIVTLNDGTEVSFERLLLATGASPRHLRGLPASERLIYYRSLADYHRVRELATEGANVIVVGGGFVGSEMAAALTLAGCQVTMVFPEPGIAWGKFPDELSKRVTEKYAERGVKIRSHLTVSEAEQTGELVKLTLGDGAVLSADLVIVGAGAIPNDELAQEAGLRVDGGVVVDEALRAINQENGETFNAIFAAGDVTKPYWPQLGRSIRIEHEDNAYAMGEAAGRAMAASLTGGAEKLPVYTHLPFFYSDLFDDGYEAVGILDTSLEIYEEWNGNEGIVYYLEDGRVKGVLLWNTWGQVDAARDLIEEGKQYGPGELKGRLPRDDDD